jgi:hypothetical protein
MSETLPPLGIQRVKVVAVAVTDLERANRFYKEKLGLQPAFEGSEHVGWWLGQVILMLKPDWATPTDLPNPRVRVGRDYGNFGRNGIKVLNCNKKRKRQLGEFD